MRTPMHADAGGAPVYEEPPTWAERIRAVRQARGWSQLRLAQHLGCSAAAVQAWEYRRSAAPIPIYRRMLEQLERDTP